MPKHDLNDGDRALLILLMTIGTEIPNADLKKRNGVDLDKGRRENLENQRLIKVRKDDKGRIHLALTEPGRNAVLDLIASPPAPGGGLLAAATHALLAQAAQYLERTGGKPADFFPEAVDLVDLVDLDDEAIEDRIRKAYDRLAGRAGEYVSLTKMRGLLGAISRDRVDEVLVRMNRTPSVTISPEANQKALTAADRAAAVIIGNQPKHSIAIGRR